MSQTEHSRALLIEDALAAFFRGWAVRAGGELFVGIAEVVRSNDCLKITSECENKIVNVSALARDIAGRL
jgi:hypothetical protein